MKIWLACVHRGYCFALFFLTFYPLADLKDKQCVRKDIKNFGSELVQMSVFLLTVLPIASLKKEKNNAPSTLETL